MSFESLPQSQQKPEAKVIRGREATYQKMVEAGNKANQIWDRNIENYTLQKLRSDPFIQDKTPEELKKMFINEVETLSKKENISVGNLEIQMHGIPHRMEAIPVLRKQLETVIQSTDFTILETGVQINDPKVARSEVTKLDPVGLAFFQIEEMARRHKKKVILTDPGYSSDEVPSAEYQKRLIELDNKIQKSIQGGTSAAGMATVAAGTGYALYHALNQKSVSRRSLLKMGTGAAVAAGAGWLANEILTADSDHKAMQLDPGERMKVYNLYDYRDVVIAEGINQVAHSFTRKMKAALIFGTGHIDGIKFYLENPQMRALKLEAYAPYAAISRAELSVNEFVPDEVITEQKVKEYNFGEWKRTSRFDILPKTKTPQ